MTAKGWRKKIISQCTANGTFSENFDAVVETLAAILEQRDNVFKQFVDEGSCYIVTHTSDRGSKSEIKNPLLQVWCELNRDALNYWKELGLTPTSLKKLNDSALEPKQKKDSLVEVLARFGG